jgi:hypothetical protein
MALHVVLHSAAPRTTLTLKLGKKAIICGLIPPYFMRTALPAHEKYSSCPASPMAESLPSNAEHRWMPCRASPLVAEERTI